MASSTLDNILEERGKEYGDFREQFGFADDVHTLMQIQPNWDELTGAQREVLHMVSHKLSRILHGNADNEDSWRDIAGYTTLIADALEAST